MEKKLLKSGKLKTIKKFLSLTYPLLYLPLLIIQKYKKNIELEFSSTDLYPFDTNNVDYTKIIVLAKQLKQIDSNVENVMSQLMFIESKIIKLDVDLLDLIKTTHKGGYAWDGNEEAALLFKLWFKVKHDIVNYDNQTNTSNSSPFHQPNTTNYDKPIHNKHPNKQV